jgi:hypothetical protein
MLLIFAWSCIVAYGWSTSLITSNVNVSTEWRTFGQEKMFQQQRYGFVLTVYIIIQTHNWQMNMLWLKIHLSPWKKNFWLRERPSEWFRLYIDTFMVKKYIYIMDVHQFHASTQLTNEHGHPTCTIADRTSLALPPGGVTHTSHDTWMSHDKSSQNGADHIISDAYKKNYE